MKLKTLLEAPLADITVHKGKYPGSFSERDAKLIQKYTVEKTYHKKLAKVPLDLYVYVIDKQGLEVFGKTYPEGELKDLTQATYGRGLQSIDLTEPPFDTVLSQVKANLKAQPSSTHFIIGDNYSAEEEMSLTPWIIIHRLTHSAIGNEIVSLFATKFERIHSNARQALIMSRGHEAARHFDTEAFLGLLGHLFTFKSATSNKLQAGELFNELATQYLVTGDIPLTGGKFLAAASKYLDKFEAEEALEAFAETVDYLKVKVRGQLEHMHGRVYYI